MDDTTDHLHRIDALRADPAPGIARLPATGDLDAAHRSLVEALRPRWGVSRNLATGGFVDPTLDDDCGLALTVPFGGRLVELCGWAVRGRWIGCGIVRDDDGSPYLVAVTARQADPATACLPAAEAEAKDEDEASGARWLRGLAVVTGRPRSREWPVDWPSAEARLGTALPADYRDLAEYFGPGTFAGFLNVFLPGPPPGSDAPFPNVPCLVRNAGRLAELTADLDIADVYYPHGLHPAPGGLLQWASSEQADQFYWLTEGADPNRWPVIAHSEDGDLQARFDGSTTEFIHRLLTDHRHPFSISELLDHSDFEPYEACEPDDPSEDRRLP
ncbi:hypothetical protein ACFVSN_30750 [Kitasatospora sp. NPDC057904]|uniref:hypothetical protein n=1 Tax=Kitasatospora sp. NPDC057904 TaxID=3346275 RepID=UPI0036DC1434